jgi:ABC-2 type transport system ATP-binding protein
VDGILEALSLDAVGVRYRRRQRAQPVDALVDVTLRVSVGEIVAVLGPNGSGKTTMLGVLAGEIAPNIGRARVLGHPPGHRELVRAVGYQPDGPLPFRQLAARSFLAFVAALMGLPGRAAAERADWLLELLGLADTGRRAVGTFSAGMQRRLALAAALLADPRVLLLDEPTSGLDPAGSLLVMQILQERARAGGTVVLASHHLQEIEQICHRVCVLDRGRKTLEGTLDEVLGTGNLQLIVGGLDDAARGRLEAEARALGAEVFGWRRERRHLFDLFRELGP